MSAEPLTALVKRVAAFPKLRFFECDAFAPKHAPLLQAATHLTNLPAGALATTPEARKDMVAKKLADAKTRSQWTYVDAGELADKGMRELGETLLTLTGLRLGSFKCAAFAVPPAATVVSLEGTSARKLSPGGATLLAGVLQFNTTLTSINLLKNSMGLAAAQRLVRLFRQSRTLTTLCGFSEGQTEADLRKQELRDGDALLVGADLERNQTLTSVDLRENFLADRAKSGEAAQKETEDAVNVLAAALGGNTSLKRLAVSNQYQPLRASFARAVAESLKVNATLETLELTPPDDEMGMALAEALKVNRTLTSVTMAGSGSGEGYSFMSPIGAHAIVDALRVNTTLRKIDLRRHGFGDEEEQLLTDAVRGRPGFELILGERRPAHEVLEKYPPPPPPPPPWEEPLVDKDFYTVKLVKFYSTDEIKLIKAVSKLVGLNFNKAKDLIASQPPVVIKADMPKADALAMKEQLEAAARCTIWLD